MNFWSAVCTYGEEKIEDVITNGSRNIIPYISTCTIKQAENVFPIVLRTFSFLLFY